MKTSKHRRKQIRLHLPAFIFRIKTFLDNNKLNVHCILSSFR